MGDECEPFNSEATPFCQCEQKARGNLLVIYNRERSTFEPTPAASAILRKAWKALDRDCDGKLNRREIAEWVKVTNGFDPTEEQLLLLTTVSEGAGSGSSDWEWIGFDGFVYLFLIGALETPHGSVDELRSLETLTNDPDGLSP